MSKIIVFGAGGRAGRSIVAEAQFRGHEAVAVVRRPLAYPNIAAVKGDATVLEDVRRTTKDADVVVNAIASMDVPAIELYTAATRTLTEGIGTGRLLTIGIGTTLETASGVRVMDAPDFPADAKAFSEGHAVELQLLASSPSTLDWVVLTPPPVFLDEESEARPPLQVQRGPALLTSSDPDFSYSDLAVATLDEIETPRHHRTQIAVARV